LLAAGTKGKRFALPNSRIMIHQPLGGVEGQASDIEIHAKEIMNIKDKLNKILCEATGQPIEKIVEDTDRNYFMSAEESKKYGIIDDVLTQRQIENKKSKGKNE
jgi:ATP-dependent Clp protease protease subunit